MCKADYAPNSLHQLHRGSFENNDDILDLFNLDLAAT